MSSWDLAALVRQLTSSPVDMAVVAAAGLWAHMRSVHSPTLQYAPTEQNLRRVAALPALSRSYWPFPVSSSWWGPLSGWTATAGCDHPPLLP